MQPWVSDVLIDLYESLTTASILVKIINIIEYFSQKQRDSQKQKPYTKNNECFRAILPVTSNKPHRISYRWKQ